MKDFPYTVEDFFQEELVTDNFIGGRYPYTYACDFIRESYFNICEVIGIEPNDYPNSRSAASQFMAELNGGTSDYRHIAIVFANAYCKREHITVPKILGFQVNLNGTEFAVGNIFPTYESAFKWVQQNPSKHGYHSIVTVFDK